MDLVFCHGYSFSCAGDVVWIVFLDDVSVASPSQLPVREVTMPVHSPIPREQSKPAVTTAPHQLGLLLRHWRARRAKSQLALAHAAGVSPRHLSFVESGRSSPSREFLLTLADALDVPLRERNLLLGAAGFAPMFPESALSTEEMGQVRSALARLLEHQEPYPAVVLDRQWNIVQTNRSAPKLFGLFIDLEAQPKPRNLLRTMFDAKGMRPFIANWDVVSRMLVQRVFREAVGGVPDARTISLLHELAANPAASVDLGSASAFALPFHPVRFSKGDLDLSFFSMITTVGAPIDVTAQELRIEAFFPADRETEAFARQHLVPE
jgi:transcriptional regulator with XRE-family HTH domain